MALAYTQVIFLEKVLHDIREAETHADHIITEAKEKAAHLLLKGKADADAFVSQRKQEVLTQKAEDIRLATSDGKLPKPDVTLIAATNPTDKTFVAPAVDRETVHKPHNQHS